MADFGHLKQLEVSNENTAEYTIHQIAVNGKTPTLILAPATEANKGYFNNLLKRAGKSARQVKAGMINLGLVEENREEDKELYPEYVIRGWKDVLDVDGSDVKFSKKEAQQFINLLPNWIFDDIRNFAGNPGSFAEILDIEISAKNSQSG